KKLSYVLAALCVLLGAGSAFAQGPNINRGPANIIHFNGVPSGNCQGNQLGQNDLTSDLYNCTITGMWHAVGGGTSITATGLYMTTAGATAPSGSVATNYCNASIKPSMWGQDINGNLFVLGGISTDNNANTPTPFGTWTICNRMWINDTGV